jgi:hypothetical protein
MARDSIAQISTTLVTLDVSADTGRYQARLPDGSPVILNGQSRASGHGGTLSSADPHLERSIAREAVADSVGRGERMILTCHDLRQRCDLTVTLTVYEGIASAMIEATFRNSGKDEVVILDLRPCHLDLAAGEALDPPAATPHSVRNSRILTNGYLYSDPGWVEHLASNRSVQSLWNLAIVNPVSGAALVAGYVSHDQAETQLTVDYDMRVQPAAERGGLGFTARSTYGANVVVRPGQSLRSDRLLFTWATTPDAALKTYGRVYRDANQIRRKPPLVGWCSWYYTYRQVTEDEILRNARFIAAQLKDYGLDLIQSDDGFQRGFGDWEGNERFPHGMKWLADQIHQLGLRAGLWLAPYVIDRDTPVGRDHPEWMGQQTNGETKLCVSGAATAPTYALEPTHPEGRTWLRDLFQWVARECGYDMVKIDFVEWSVLAIERYHEQSIGRAGAYRLGLQTIREALGPRPDGATATGSSSTSID